MFCFGGYFGFFQIRGPPLWQKLPSDQADLFFIANSGKQFYPFPAIFKKIEAKLRPCECPGKKYKMAAMTSSWKQIVKTIAAFGLRWACCTIGRPSACLNLLCLLCTDCGRAMLFWHFRHFDQKWRTQSTKYYHVRNQQVNFSRIRHLTCLV